MTPRLVLGIGLVLAGAALDVSIAIALGIVTVGFEATHILWARRGIQAVGIRRRLGSHRVPWGETTPLTLEAWNRGALPLSWVRTDDAVTDHAVVPGRTLLPGELSDRILRNTWTLGPRELESRHSLEQPVREARRRVLQE